MFPSVSCILLIFLLNYTCYGWVNGSNLDHEAEVNSTLRRRLRQSDTEVLITDYKYMVSVTVSEKKCSGVFIQKPSSVLTSATCVTHNSATVEASTITIRYGTRISNVGGKATVGAELLVPPQFDPSISSEYNVAVIKTKDPIAGDYIEPLLINVNDNYEDIFKGWVAGKSVCKVLGFGIGPNGDSTQQVLNALAINLIDNDQCKRMLDNFLKPETHVSLEDKVCAFTSGIDPCHGDGGQLLKCGDPQQGPTGIFWFGQECGQENRPAIFTRVDKWQQYFIGPALNRGSPHTTSSSSWNRFNPSLVGTTSALLIIADIKKRFKYR